MIRPEACSPDRSLPMKALSIDVKSATSELLSSEFHRPKYCDASIEGSAARDLNAAKVPEITVSRLPATGIGCK